MEKNQCACIPHVIRNKSLKPIICSYWYRILKSTNASAIEEVNSGLLALRLCMWPLFVSEQQSGGDQGSVPIMSLMFLNTGAFGL